MITAKVNNKKFVKWCRKFPKSFRRELIIAATQAGKTLRAALYLNVYGQRLSWTGLSESYLEYKREQGFDLRVYMRSTLFTKVLTSRRAGFGGWAGVPGAVRWPPNLGGIADWTKLGKRPRPGKHHEEPTIASAIAFHDIDRPLFEPTAKIEAPRIREIYAKALARAIVA